MLRGQHSAREGAHLSAGLDPGLGEDAEALAGDGALGDDHLAGQHQAGQLLHLWGRKREIINISVTIIIIIIITTGL